jgi:hypothetical protein
VLLHAVLQELRSRDNVNDETGSSPPAKYCGCRYCGISAMIAEGAMPQPFISSFKAAFVTTTTKESGLAAC